MSSAFKDSAKEAQEQAEKKLREADKSAEPTAPATRASAAKLLSQALFGAQAQDAVDRVGCAVRGGVEVPHLKLAEQTDAHHLNSGKNEDAGDDEDGAVKRHDVLAGDDLEDQEPDGHAGAG